jgi:hypothetical protein
VSGAGEVSLSVVETVKGLRASFHGRIRGSRVMFRLGGVLSARKDVLLPIFVAEEDF